MVMCKSTSSITTDVPFELGSIFQHSKYDRPPDDHASTGEF
jgi:hypothetical protein